MIDDLVSIIMPAYNAEKYIEEAIESVLKQTYRNWELIIVNDCSIDATEQIVKKYQEQDERIKFHSLTENHGVANARNTALQNAVGRYIAFLDSDDMWLPEKLEKQIGFMKINNYVFTYHQYRHFASRDKVGKIVNIPLKLGYKEALKGNSMGCLTVCLDKSKIKPFLMPVQRHEDYITWLRILGKGGFAAGINRPYLKYRLSEEGKSRNKLKSAAMTYQVYRYVGYGPLKSLFFFVSYALHGIWKYR